MLHKRIEFISSFKKELLHPVPIKKLVPDWYKQMKNYHNNSVMTPTIKKCVPFLDSLTSGYAILNVVDIVFKKINDGKELTYQINDNFPCKELNVGVQNHYAHQISSEMLRDNEEDFPIKLLNPWIIKTPKNYSCLFTNPFNHSHERKIRILDAIVDTDSFEVEINFPCFLKKIPNEQEYIFKKGEIIALVFPFLRNDWKMEVTDKIDKNPLDKYIKSFSRSFDNYKSVFWKKKKYD
jgi:hypothetical protein